MRREFLASVLALLFCLGAESLAEDQGSAAPPESDSDAPPLVVPPGFTCTLFARHPLLQHPSAMTAGPRPGSVFVARDYLTFNDASHRDEIYLLEDTSGDGCADEVRRVAEGLNSVQGLLLHEGELLVMHAPWLSALRDEDGDGMYEGRRDLITGLGLPPEKNPMRLHSANGIVAGYDGWLYLAVGDYGVDVMRAEGDRLQLTGGGILRCRPDGRDLHVFSSGLRNIYDVALDNELNVFVRDNENDGGTYMVRVAHSFSGAHHGYPYHYEEFADEAMRPLADLGRGASAGGACYLEMGFPAEYRGDLFFCEWGRSVVRYHRQAQGSGFAPMQEFVFATGAENDPWGFKPTDLIIERNGSLLVCDWADSQRPQAERGRIFRIRPENVEPSQRPIINGQRSLEELLRSLDHPSYSIRMESQGEILHRGPAAAARVQEGLTSGKLGERAGRHAVWIAVELDPAGALPELLRLAEGDGEASLRLQAVRAIADLCDPVLATHRLDAGRGPDEVAIRLAVAAKPLAGEEPGALLREIVVALGRLRWEGLPDWMAETFARSDAALAHAAQQSLRQCGNWPGVLRLLDSDKGALHEIVLRAVAEQPRVDVVDGLLDRLAREDDPRRRLEYAALLARVCRLPAPAGYWGFRPAPRPAGSVDWERTDAILQALNEAALKAEETTRLQLLARLQRERITLPAATLESWMTDESDPTFTLQVLEMVAECPTDDVRRMTSRCVADTRKTQECRQKALQLLRGSLEGESAEQWLRLATQLEEGPLLAEVLGELRRFPELPAEELLSDHLSADDPLVRSAAVRAAAVRDSDRLDRQLLELLSDSQAPVRREAALAVGMRGLRPAVADLRRLARDPAPEVRGASLESLLRLDDPGAVDAAVSALDHPITRLPAVNYLAKFGTPEQFRLIVVAMEGNRSQDLFQAAVKALIRWREDADTPSETRREIDGGIARLQGDQGMLLCWRVAGPFPEDRFSELTANEEEVLGSTSRMVTGLGSEGLATIPPADESDSGSSWVAAARFQLPAAAHLEFLGSGDAPQAIWLNGQTLTLERSARAGLPDRLRAEGDAREGSNVLLLRLEAGRPAEFQWSFRAVSTSAEQEALARFALQNTGNVERGRALFLNVEKTLCAKCHRIGATGGMIGPDLTGIGSRFSRIHLIESVLTPSRSLAQGYETFTVALRDGRVLTGVGMPADDQHIVLGDAQGERHEIPRDQIEQQVSQRVSIMPEGLEKRLTRAEFSDLISFLVSQTKSAADER